MSSSSPARRRRYDSDAEEESARVPPGVSSYPLPSSSSSSSSSASTSAVLVENSSSSSSSNNHHDDSHRSSSSRSLTRDPSPDPTTHRHRSSPHHHDHHHRHHHHHHRSHRQPNRRSRSRSRDRTTTSSRRSRSRSRSPSSSRHHRNHRKHHRDHDHSQDDGEHRHHRLHHHRYHPSKERQDSNSPISPPDPDNDIDGKSQPPNTRPSTVVQPIQSSSTITPSNSVHTPHTNGTSVSATIDHTRNADHTRTIHRPTSTMAKVLSPERPSKEWDDPIGVNNPTNHPNHQRNPPPVVHSNPPSASSTTTPATLVEKPNFGLSGVLAREPTVSSTLPSTASTKSVKKYMEPSDSRIPDKRYKLFIFKGKDEITPPIFLQRRSSYLIGRDHATVDISIDHPSCSKHHAVIQFRLVPLPQEPGDMNPPQRTVKPYLIDLEATNGTFLNHQRIDPARYIELRSTDIIKFGQSTREYVFMAEE